MKPSTWAILIAATLILASATARGEISVDERSTAGPTMQLVNGTQVVPTTRLAPVDPILEGDLSRVALTQQTCMCSPCCCPYTQQAELCDYCGCEDVCGGGDSTTSADNYNQGIYQCLCCDQPGGQCNHYYNCDDPP